MALDIETIRKRCIDAINHPILGQRPDCEITFVLPGVSSAATRRLCGRRGPRGQNFADTEDGNLVAFKAREVLAWLDREFPRAEQPKGGA